MGNMSVDMRLGNPCVEKRDFCINCKSEFMMIRPSIREAVVSRHFIRDLKNEEEMNSIIRDILDCSSLEFTELHKFEENLNGNLIFRAKRRGMHIVYCVDKKLRIIFLRAIKNYTEYKKFLEDKKEITKMISHA